MCSSPRQGSLRPGGRLGILVLACGIAPTALPAQVEPPPTPPDSAGYEVEVVPGARYRAGRTQRLLLGDNRRPLWLTPIEVPVLDLERFAGGLTPVERGGNQTLTLHFVDPDGREWIFRSVDKTVAPELPPDLLGTLVHRVMQDYTSALHPAGALVVSPLHDALGLLSDDPGLVVMPNDARLGRHRSAFAGLLGQIVRRPNEGEEGRAPWRDYDRVIGTDRLLEWLAAEPGHRVDAEEFLAARLIDFLVGDPDRGLDQWRWAREDEEGGVRWRPIARDRDWAFFDADGAVAWLVGMLDPKVVDFGEELPPIERVTAGDEGLDRRLLTSLDRAAFMRVATRVVEGLTDSVIAEAVARLPPAMHTDHAPDLAAALRTRRSGLAGLAARFYRRLAEAPDLHGTEGADRVAVRRRTDGSVDVTFSRQRAAHPAVTPIVSGHARAVAAPRPHGNFQRRFRPDETDEIRIFLRGGDDVAVVRGKGPRPGAGIVVRIIGGSGRDELIDAAEGGRTVLYDTGDRDHLAGGRGTRIDRRPYRPPPLEADWLTAELGPGERQDWGSQSSWLTPAVGYGEGAGVIVGVGPTWTRYGFRRDPYRSRFAARALLSTRTGELGVEVEARHQLESSPVSLGLDARATRFGAVRFYGYGNDSPEPSSHDHALVMQDQIRIQPSVRIGSGDLSAAAGPLVVLTDAHPAEGGPADRLGPPGSDAFTQLGLQVEASLDRTEGTPSRRSGYRVRAGVAGFAAAPDAAEPFGRLDMDAHAYLPVPVWHDPVLALRVGAQRSVGPFPIHEAARIGGAATLRGYRWQRFAGDAAATAGAELRVPLTRAQLIVNGRLGALVLADAGRVWQDGASPGGWHAGWGAGLWFESLGRAVHLVWARGEESRLYVGFGLPY